VPIKEDPALAQILSLLDIDEQIPSELYKAVAEILAFVIRLMNGTESRGQRLKIVRLVKLLFLYPFLF